MIFPIKWGDMESLLKKQFSTEQEGQSPFFYFEDPLTLSLYHETKKGNVLQSHILLDSIENLESFKMEYLGRATELVAKPKSGVFVFRQE